MAGRRDFFTKILGGAVAAVVAPYLPTPAAAAAPILTVAPEIYVPVVQTSTGLAALTNELKRSYSPEVFDQILDRQAVVLHGLTGLVDEGEPALRFISKPTKYPKHRHRRRRILRS
jgi:hypothetical protein